MFSSRRTSAAIQSATRRTVRAMIEQLENRQLLSAGNPDPTFAGDGVSLNIPNLAPRGSINDVAVQSDGKIVASLAITPDQFDFAVQRYLPNGTLDTSFGNGGTAVLPWGPNSPDTPVAQNMAVAVQSDGKIVLGGRFDNLFAIMRLTSTGQLDSSFDGDGMATTDFGNGASGGIRDLAIQSDGKIVAVGSSNGQVALARYTTSGALDTTFDGDGKVLTNITGNGERMNAVAIQSDGKIVTAGAGSPSGLKLALFRYTTSGKLDTTFNGNGERVTSTSGELEEVAIQSDGKIVGVSNTQVIRFNSNGSTDTGFASSGLYSTTGYQFRGLGLQSSGKIVLGGSTNVVDQPPQGAVLRLNSNGTLDTSFASAGTKLFKVYDETTVDSVKVLGDGRILEGGISGKQYSLPFLARFSSANSAALDSAFGIGGIVTRDLTQQVAQFADVKTQSDGKVVALGFTESLASHNQDIYLVRFNADGTRDTSFGNNGSVIIDAFGSDEIGESLAIGSDGKIVVLGSGVINPTDVFNPDRAFVLLRYNSNGTPDTSFGDNGKVLQNYSQEREQSGLIALQSTGKIILAASFADFHGTITRFNTNGSIDTAFGGQGTGSTSDIDVSDLAVQADDRIVYSGVVYSLFADGGAVGRLTSNGLVDDTFAGDGTYQLGNPFLFGQLELAPDGSVLVKAKASNTALAHLTSNGQELSVSPIPDDGILAVQSDGKALVVDGLTDLNNGIDPEDIIIRRYVVDPTNLDATFGDSGAAVANFAPVDVPLNAVVGANGRLYIAGYVTADNSSVPGPLIAAIQLGNQSPPQTGSLSGFTFDDTNTNGQFDSGEQKTSGKTVFLDTNGNGTLDASERSTVTDANGNYTFSNLDAGTYHVRRVFPAGYGYSTAPIDVTLAAGQNLGNLAIGSEPVSSPPPQTGSLVGFTFDDKNVDGQYETGEVKTGGKTVFLDTNGNNALDAGERSTVTDSSGNYSFTNLPAGTYHVRRVFPDGWTYSTAAIDVTLAAGQTITNLAIGSKAGPTNPPPTQTSISGFTFDDTDADGVYDSNEPKTSGKTVFLDTNENGQLDSGERSVVTDSSGSFTFNNLSAGTYHVRRVFPSGWTYSTAPIDIDLSSGESVAAVAIGSKPVSQQTGIIRGFTFNDTNENGQYDTGEQKTSGKRVFLDVNNNGFPDPNDVQAFSAADGSFSFTDLAAGTYHVRREFPSGYTYSTPLIDVNLQPGEIFADALIGSKPTT